MNILVIAAHPDAEVLGCGGQSGSSPAGGAIITTRSGLTAAWAIRRRRSFAPPGKPNRQERSPLIAVTHTKQRRTKI
jgi:hypothetical protein